MRSLRRVARIKKRQTLKAPSRATSTVQKSISGRHVEQVSSQPAFFLIHFFILRNLLRNVGNISGVGTRNKVLSLDAKLTFQRPPAVITGMRGVKTGVSPPRRNPPGKYMYRYVGHVISATEKSDLDQVSSLIRPSSR